MRGARIAVTSRRRGPELVTALERRGAAVLLGPTVSGDIAAPDEELVAATRAAAALDPDWFVASTGMGMKLWSEAALRHGLLDQLRSTAAGARCVARGDKAVGGLARVGATPEWVSPTNTDREVATWVLDRVRRGDRLVIQQHGGRTTAFDELDRLDVQVLRVTPYRWGLPEDRGPARAVAEAAVAGELDLVTFTSPGAVAHLFEIAGPEDGEDLRPALAEALAGPVAVASVGPVTGEAVEAHGGVNVVVPERWRQADLVRGIEEWWAARDGVAAGADAGTDTGSS